MRDRVRREHFERDYAVQFFVVRFVDRAHAASADGFDDAVMRYECAFGYEVHKLERRVITSLTWLLFNFTSKRLIVVHQSATTKADRK